MELDVLEANNWAMQTAIHTETGGSFGSGNCDRNGCFARVGGPMAPGTRGVALNFAALVRVRA